MSITKSIMSQAANEWSGPKYVEDVFSNSYYTGTGVTKNISNGLDLSNDGGMVWFKRFGVTYDHHLYDNVVGLHRVRFPNLQNPDTSTSSPIIEFNSDGYSLLNGSAQFNSDGYSYASWCFKRAPKFFDIVVYSGDGSTSHEIPHNLQETPGMMIIRDIDQNDNWHVWHVGSASAHNSYSYWNNTNAETTNATTMWSQTSPTDTHFTVGQDNLNYEGSRYVAYLFANNNGNSGFGDDGDLDIIKCGSYTGISTTVNLGFKPQFIMLKNLTQSRSWIVADNRMNGDETGTSWAQNDNNSYVLVSSNTGTPSTVEGLDVTAEGFTINTSFDTIGDATDRFAYVAIRGEDDRIPTDASKVFAVRRGASPWYAGFPVDMMIQKNTRGSTGDWNAYDRERGHRRVFRFNTTAIEQQTAARGFSEDTDLGKFGGAAYTAVSTAYAFKKARGFFDIITWTAENGKVNVPHSLGVKPELAFVKALNDSTLGPVAVGSALDFTVGTVENYAYQETANADAFAGTNGFRDEIDTAQTFGLRTNNSYFNSPAGDTYVAYLFASCPGVCSIGSFDGAAGLEVDCGFTSGPRFLLIRRGDAGGSWYVFDTATGFTPTEQRWLRLDFASELTPNESDFIIPTSTGFTVGSGVLAPTSGKFLYMAIA